MENYCIINVRSSSGFVYVGVCVVKVRVKRREGDGDNPTVCSLPLGKVSLLQGFKGGLNGPALTIQAHNQSNHTG